MRTERFSHLCFFGLFFLILFSSCENKPDYLGIDLIPTGDAITVSFDSLGIVHGYTVYGDSVLGMKKANYILGSQVDPYFGLTKADIISQIEPFTTIGSFGSNPVVDSAVFYLVPDDIKGTPAPSMQMMLYEYTEWIDKDSLYWSNMDITGKYRDEAIGTANISSSDTLIRILISDTVFINKFLQAPDSVLRNTAYLQEYVNGLYITMEDPVSEGIFLTMGWQTEKHKLTFYYGNDSISSNDSTSAFSLDFPIGSLSTGINLFQHDFTGYPIEPFINNGSNDDSLMFVQSMAGVSPIIRLEGITEWTDSLPVAIIDAKLTIPVADSILTLQRGLYMPDNLGLLYIEDSYKLNYDYLLDYDAAGGDYDIYTNSFVFNLKVQMQSIIQGNVDNFELILRPIQENETISRAVLYGWSQDPDKRIRLEITYTTF